MLNVDGSGGIKVEFFEMQVGGGGAPAGGPGGPGGGMMTMLMGGDKLCVDGPNAFPSASSCQSPSTELLNLSSTGLITLATGWAVESGGDDPNYALSSGSRQLGSNDGFAKYKLENSSTKQKLEVEIGSSFTYDNKWDVEIKDASAMHQGGGSGGSHGGDSQGGGSAPTLWANYASCSTSCTYKTETHGNIQKNSSNFGLSQTKQIMMQLETSPPASLKDISNFMMPINGVAGVFNSSSNLSFASGVSISESIVFENMQMGPSTGVMVMFLYQRHDNHERRRSSTLSAFSADTDLTSTLSGITFQSSKPSDYGSSGGGSSGGGSSSATIYPVYGNFDNPQNVPSGLMNPIDSVFTLTNGPKNDLNLDFVIANDELDDSMNCDSYKRQNLSFPIAGKNHEALIHENCQNFEDDNGNKIPSMLIQIVEQNHLITFVSPNVTTLSNFQNNSGILTILSGLTYKTRTP